jgi:hypothetical protein
MIRNPTLVSRAKVYARELKIEDRDAIYAMVEGYEVACGLSVGPVPSRSKVWEGKAEERRAKLCRTVGFQE